MQLTARAALWQASISGTIWMPEYVVAGGTGIDILETRTLAAPSLTAHYRWPGPRHHRAERVEHSPQRTGFLDLNTELAKIDLSVATEGGDQIFISRTVTDSDPSWATTMLTTLLNPSPLHETPRMSPRLPCSRCPPTHPGSRPPLLCRWLTIRPGHLVAPPPPSPLGCAVLQVLCGRIQQAGEVRPKIQETEPLHHAGSQADGAVLGYCHVGRHGTVGRDDPAVPRARKEYVHSCGNSANSNDPSFWRTCEEPALLNSFPAWNCSHPEYGNS